MSSPCDIKLRHIKAPSPEDIDIVSRKLARYNDRVLGETMQSRVILAEENGKSVGGLYFWWYAPAAYIDLFALDEDYRRQGIGTQLLTEAETVLLEAGCTQITLSTMLFQGPDFYPRFGYTPITTIPNFFGKTDAIIYRKFLAFPIIRPEAAQG